MADLIAGQQFALNPAEAFVFGGAVLLHDAGMSVHAYEAGKWEVEESREWQDAFAAALQRITNQNDTPPDAETQQVAKSLAIVDTLRVLHAKKAETSCDPSLATAEFYT